MDIASGHAAGRVTEQAGDCQLAETEVAGDRRKGMAERVRSNAFQLGPRTDARQNLGQADEVTLTALGRENPLDAIPVGSDPRLKELDRLPA